MHLQVLAVNQAYDGFSGGPFSSSADVIELTDAYIESTAGEERVKAPSSQCVYPPPPPTHTHAHTTRYTTIPTTSPYLYPIMESRRRI
jgi:hypothetical protein